MRRTTVKRIYDELEVLIPMMSGQKTKDIITAVIHSMNRKGFANPYLTRQRVSGCISAWCCKYQMATCVNSCLY